MERKCVYVKTHTYKLKCMQMQGIEYEHVELVTTLRTNTGKIQGSISESIDASLYYFRHL